MEFGLGNICSRQFYDNCMLMRIVNNAWISKEKRKKLLHKYVFEENPETSFSWGKGAGWSIEVN